MKKQRWLIYPALLLLVIFSFGGVNAGEKLKVGVALHPYYSWLKNIVGDTMDIISIIPDDADPHAYQPRPNDLQRIASLDVVVINGLGHDDYLKPMIKAAGRENMQTISPNQGLPLIPSYGQSAGDGERVAYNSHTYIAITGAIQQINTLVRELGKLQPQHKQLYRDNARAYNRKLRQMLTRALAKINEADAGKVRIATVHDGYAYLFQELGLEVAAVIQPRHGIEPSARQLMDTIKQIKQANVNVLFAEMDYKKQYVDIIFRETGCRIYTLTHVSNGPFSADKFEKDMQKNLDTIVKALTDVE